MSTITVGTFAAAHRIAATRGNCKIQRLHANAWVVIPEAERKPSRLARQLARRRKKIRAEREAD
jgi:hypothetical protein